MAEIEKLLKEILPSGINWQRYEYKEFEVVGKDPNIPSSGIRYIYIEEKNIIPSGYAQGGEVIISKGFHGQKYIIDFPIRGMKTVVVKRKRRWINISNNTIISDSTEYTYLCRNTKAVDEFVRHIKWCNHFLKIRLETLSKLYSLPISTISHYINSCK